MLLTQPYGVFGLTIQAKLDQLGLLEEERDFLVHEKATLVDRIGNLEARQGSFQERERQAENRGAILTNLKVCEGVCAHLPDRATTIARRLLQGYE